MVWILQETHVSSEDEKLELAAEWRRIWGLQHQTGGAALSYWSVDASKTGGVAILLNPTIAATVQPWQQSRWTNRVIAIQTEDRRVVNVYAPNTHAEREIFFQDLHAWKDNSLDIILAGDFNCVLSPALDRLGGVRQGRPESLALQTLVQQLQLEDASTLAQRTDGEEETYEPTEYYTYWGPEAASRIDRIYVPASWTATVQWVAVEEPPVPSDHQRVRLYLGQAVKSKQTGRLQRRPCYPLRSAQPERTQQELMEGLTAAGVGREVTTQTWDRTVRTSIDCIRQQARVERKRRKRYKHRQNVKNRAHLITRRDLLGATLEEEREELLVRQGQNLERTTEQMRWQFKRASNWERDQTIQDIHHIHGPGFQRNMTLATKFSTEWKPILGVIHSPVAIIDLEHKFDAFVSIPKQRQLREEQNEALMHAITSQEVIQAIAELNRHKAAGPDGLNNDFFKDAQAILVPALVAIGNELLHGADPPPSFLEALIIPLKKKGDSVDAMNFRPISLLQTGYKIFMKVIATRAQRVMGTPIGDSQQGFVHGRQLMKTVMMMLAVLDTAQSRPEVEAAMSQVILLLDFKKAYDTVSREFLFLAMRKFGFSRAFIAMIKRLHEGTTARFLVNGELSEPLDIISGIRQGCPLAPLLFLLAAEVLAIAIQQDKQIRGIAVPGGKGEEHTFSAFVDDSTVFLQEANQLPHVMQLVDQFGELSGLRVQPTKSKVIYLNTAVTAETTQGIPVLQHGDTVRYLGFEVGTGPMTDVNWATRIRSIKRRLATASQLATSVANRVTLLNVVLLPSVLFTAMAFEMPNWAEHEIRNLQKQFLWQHSTNTGASRHKVNPSLLFTPKKAGGVGLASVGIACKTQRAKHAVMWLVQRHDRYYDAWRAWAFRGATQPWTAGVSPRVNSGRQLSTTKQTPGNTLQRLIGSWLEPQLIPEESRRNRESKLQIAEDEAISWTTGDRWRVEILRKLPGTVQWTTAANNCFGATYYWNDNPAVVDAKGAVLTCTKYDRIQSCSLAALHITREEDRVFSMTIPTRGEKPHRQDKLRRWGLAVLSSVPQLAVGTSYHVGTTATPRHMTKLQNTYSWTIAPNGTIIGSTIKAGSGDGGSFELQQKQDGIHWEVTQFHHGGGTVEEDIRKLRRREQDGGIVFNAHPRLHSFPWDVPDTVANKHVLVALKKQAFRRYRGEQHVLSNMVERLQQARRRSTWQAAVMDQTPTNLWEHNNELTEYQVWVCYRIAVRQLNLFNDGRKDDSSCRQLKQCAGRKETLEHIFWDCPCAQACWQIMISHWTGEQWAPSRLERFQRNCANRKAPKLSRVIKQQLRHDHPDEQDEYEKEWKRIWRILSSVCQTSLWIQRNKVIFHEETITVEGSMSSYWTTAIRQMKAIGKRERRSLDKIQHGTRLLLCLSALESQPTEMPPTTASLAQPQDRTSEPALLARLRTNQTSSRQ